MSESERPTVTVEEPENSPVPEPEITAPRPVSQSADEIRDALNAAHSQQINSLADLTRVQVTLTQELRNIREELGTLVADLDQAATRQGEHADTLAQRTADLETRMRIEPSVSAPEPESAPGKVAPGGGKKRPRWM